MPSNPSSNYAVASESVRQALDNFMESYRIVDVVVARARELAPTSRIREAIDVEYVKSGNGEGKSRARIIVDLNIAPEGRAYEYGSGEHSRRGKAARYPIRANRKPYLVFYWDAKDITIRKKEVMHPGVAAKPDPERGYMATALQETKKEMQGRMQHEFGKAVSKAIKIAFVGA